MFLNIKVLLLSLCSLGWISASLATDPPENDRYFTKKYAFSEPKLDMTKFLKDYIGQPEQRPALLGLLKTAANNGDAVAQEKYYQFTSTQIGSMNNVNLSEAESMLTEGLAQEQTWAFWEKGKLVAKQNSSCSLNSWHFLAANREHPGAITLVQKNYNGSWSTSLDEIKTLMKGKLKNNTVQKNIIGKVQTFITTWDEIGYAQPLCELSSILAPLFQYPELRNKAILPVIQKAADLGLLKAQLSFANEQTKLDHQAQVLQYLIKAAKQGHIPALNRVGLALLGGLEGQPSDPKAALKYFLSAADQGISEDMHNAGKCYLEGGHNLPIDKAKAFQCFQQAAMLGSIDSAHQAAQLVDAGFEGHPSSPEQVAKILMPFAEKGDASAQYNVGVSLWQMGKPTDKIRARKFFSDAADQGFESAALIAGERWEEDYEGGPADLKKALHYHMKAAELNIPSGMHNAGKLLLKGFNGQAPDKRRALPYFLKAIEKGIKESLCYAGWILADPSDKFTQNKKQGLQYYLQSAENGCSSAMCNAALLLKEGFKGRPADSNRAFDLFLKSANMGEGRAMVQLALMYLDMVKEDQQNLKSALFWLEKAETLNEPDATKYLEIARQTAAQEEPDNEARLETLVKESSQILPEISTSNHSSLEEGSESPDEEEDSTSIAEGVSENPEDDEDEIPASSATLYVEKENQKKYNIKHIRSQLREMARLEKEKATQRAHQLVLKLSAAEQKIANAIFAGETQAIDHHALTTLFSSPFFQDQVEVTPTKSGIAVNAYNRTTKKSASTSTHKKTHQTYKGAQPKFVSYLKRILELFDLKPQAEGN